MRRKFYFLIIVLLLSACRSTGHSEQDRVCFGKDCVNVEVVSTPEAMEKGLMNRTSLANDSGMLFVFPKLDRYLFWMKNTLIPLDMVWMDQQRRIVYVAANVPPCKADPCPTYGPSDRDSLYVLEVNAGYCEKKKWKEGDQAEFWLN